MDREIIYYKNNKGRGQNLKTYFQTAGNVFERLIPEFNTPQVPDGSVLP